MGSDLVKEPDFLGSFTAALRDPACVQALNRSLKPNPLMQCMLNQTPSIVEINGKPYAVFKGTSDDKGE